MQSHGCGRGGPEPPSGGQQVCRLNSQREEIGDPRLLVDAHGGSSGAGVGGLQCPPLPCCRAGLQDLLSPGPGGPWQPSTPPGGPSETARSRLGLAPQRPFPDSGAGPRGRASPARAVCVDRGSPMHRWEAPAGFEDTCEKLRVSAPGTTPCGTPASLAGPNVGNYFTWHFTSCASPAPHTQPQCCRSDS